MDTKNTHLAQWYADVEKLRGQGRIICPIMTQEPGHFPADTCLCDIPQTRHSFLEQNGNEHCENHGHCLPRQALPEDVALEVFPAPPPRQKRPRGAWTAFLRKLPE